MREFTKHERVCYDQGFAASERQMLIFLRTRAALAKVAGKETPGSKALELAADDIEDGTWLDEPHKEH